MNDRIERERDHFNHRIHTPDEILALILDGPSGNDQAMLDAVEPGPGRHIVDFACGGGLSSVWLAQRGARVTGIDLSEKSIQVARAVAEELDLSDRIDFIVGDLEAKDLRGETFDGMIGRFALHHLDIAEVAPSMTACLKPGAKAAFVETMYRNPILRLARTKVVGRFGVRRVGTFDEHPLVERDVEQLRAAFGEIEVRTVDYRFFFMFSRQLFALKVRWLNRLCATLDRGFARLPVTRDWSYHQVLIATRT